MKGLFSVLGLIAALFVFNVGATQSIYDTAPYASPKIEPTPVYLCKGTSGGFYDRGGFQGCLDFHESAINQYNTLYGASCKAVPGAPSLGAASRVECSYYTVLENADDYLTSNKYKGQVYYQKNEMAKSCPPDESPLAIISHDSNNDGEIDKCFTPDNLNDASDCMSQFNNLLPVGDNTASDVCLTNPDTGGKCGYSNDGGASQFYGLNTVANCFEGDPVSEYEDPDIDKPQPDECQPYASDLFVCAADPTQECDPQGVCANGCGYVNNQFVCFRNEECTGPDCEELPIPCTGDDCEEEPDPDKPCEGDDCVPKPDPDKPCEGDDCVPSGGGGSSKFKLDYKKLSDAMEKAAKLLIDEGEMPDPDKKKKEIDDLFKDAAEEEAKLNDETAYDGYVNSFSESFFDGFKNLFPPVGNCTPIDIVIGTLDFCGAVDIVRLLLGNFFYGLTAFHIFSVFSTRFTRSKS